MRQVIENFPKQLAYQPVIENSDKLKKFGRFAVCGMGGSHLAADILTIGNPHLHLRIHKDYGLPPMDDSDKETTLVIFVSYSGNTEEVLDGFQKAREQGLALAAIGTGGKLIEYARGLGIPYVALLDDAIQPRFAVGYMAKAVLALMQKSDDLRALASLSSRLDASKFEAEGKSLALALKDRMPIIYSSRQNAPLAYGWKIRFNETSKVPAFYNFFPELNHSEISGFDGGAETAGLRAPIRFIFLRDSADSSMVRKRMEVLDNMYRERDISISPVDISSADPWEKVFAALIRADWITYYLALAYGHDPAAVPMVEEFKKLIKE